MPPGRKTPHAVRVALFLAPALLLATPAIAQSRLDIGQMAQSRDRAIHAITNGVPFVIRFNGPVRGLEPGAPVDIRGLPVGIVRKVELSFDNASGALAVLVSVEIAPNLLPRAGAGLGAQPTNAPETIAAVEALIRAGLRATLATTTPLGGETLIELDIRANAPPATLIRTGPVPEIPSAPSAVERLAERLPVLLEKISNAPVDQILADLAAATAGLNALANGPELRGTLSSLKKSAEDMNSFIAKLDERLTPLLATVNRTIDRAGTTIGSVDRAIGERSPLMTGLNSVLREASGAARNLRLLVEYLERHPEALVTGKKEIRP